MPDRPPLRTTMAVLLACALSGTGGGCGTMATPVHALPRLSPALSAPGIDGGRVLLFRDAHAGEVVVFARDLTDRATRDRLRSLSRALVGSCDPPYDVVVLIQPGLASLWPGFDAAGAKQLADGRARRAACLGDARASAAPEDEAAREVSLALDDGGDLRRLVLGRTDPGDSIAVAVYGTDGALLYRIGVSSASRGQGVLEGVAGDASAAIRHAATDRAAASGSASSTGDGS